MSSHHLPCAFCIIRRDIGRPSEGHACSMDPKFNKESIHFVGKVFLVRKWAQHVSWHGNHQYWILWCDVL